MVTAKGKPDLAFEHGIRFHLAPASHGMPPRHVMMLFGKNTPEGHASIMVNLDEPWPADIPAVTAIVIGKMDDLQEAIAFAAARVGIGRH